MRAVAKRVDTGPPNDFARHGPGEVGWFHVERNRHQSRSGITTCRLRSLPASRTSAEELASRS